MPRTKRLRSRQESLPTPETQKRRRGKSPEKSSFLELGDVSHDGDESALVTSQLSKYTVLFRGSSLMI